jgi:hypothetical protein
VPVPERKERSQLLGDFLREVAVLLAVLYPLDAYLQNKFDWSNCILVFVFSGALLWWGMILEGRDGL